MSPVHFAGRKIAPIALLVLAVIAWLTFVMTVFAQTPAPAVSKAPAATGK